MKHVMLIAFMLSLALNVSFAGEVDTECPWMKEQNERSNPKAQGIKAPSKLKTSKAVRK